MKLQIEEWKPIEGYEGLYEISTHGRVRSLPRKGSKGRIIKNSMSSSGYLQTHLCKDGIPKTYQIHRLVAKTFLDNMDGLPEVNHKDECKTNNCVWNLEFCTRLYNQNYGTAIARAVMAHNYKESAWKSAQNHDYAEVARKQSKPVLQKTLDGILVKRWNSLREVQRELGYSCGNLSGACNGKYKTMYGFVWEYERTVE